MFFAVTSSGSPVCQQMMLHYLGIELWIHLQQIGWILCSSQQC
ncbi:hypothetical protein SynBIOSE41_02788 [Synechococcus sp. BIOS-E4-1]|nr:hypothetical protein SynBIOSE41_02788 [Synechococcus sp. BIOS-E4-1]